MTQQINSSPLVSVALLPMTDGSHSLLCQLLTEAERPTVAPREVVVAVPSQPALSARQKEVVPKRHDNDAPARVRYAYD